MATRRYNVPIHQSISTRYASDLNDREFDLVAPHVAQKDGSGKKEYINTLLRRDIRTKARLDREPSVGIIDSQSVPATEMGGKKGFNPAKQVKGRKRHLMTDTLGLILFVVVRAASIADSDGAEYVFHETEGRFPRLHRLVDFAKRWFGIVVDIVKRSPSRLENGPSDAPKSLHAAATARRPFDSYRITEPKRLYVKFGMTPVDFSLSRD